MRTTLIALACFLFAGCTSSGTGVPVSDDMRDSFESLPDMAVPADLAGAPDLGLPLDLAFVAAFCLNTPVAGTCAQDYFGAVAQCFTPTGPCTYEASSSTRSDCWQSGAEFLTTIDAMTMSEHVTWKAQHGAVICMKADVEMGMGNTYVFRLTTDRGMLTFVLQSGAVTCPDGSTANIGPNYGNCSALENLINGPPTTCVQGACP